MRRTVLLAAVATMLVLAGCAGAGPGTDSAAPTEGGPADDSTADTPGETGDGTQSGTVAFYLSDDPNDIDDFRYLNVTVTEVQFHYAGNGSDEEPTGTVTPEPTTTEMTAEATPVLTATTTPGMAAAAAQDDDAETVEDDESEDDDADEEGESETDEEREEESESAASADDDDDSEGEGRWITREVNGTSIDLTELQGANATLLENFSVPAGEYTQVRLVVGEINATLTDGSDQRVKLPSGRLKLNKPFTLGPNTSVDFVFDITVHKAGNSGKYILKPVAGESGTDQEIDRRED